MPVNARDAELPDTHTILAVGDAGSGKTAQIASLPGRKFVYAFDPGTLRTLKALKVDADVEEFLPDVSSIDFTLKGFNKGSRDDKPKKPIEPTCYTAWENNFNTLYDSGAFDAYDWICFDSMTLFNQAMSNRLLFLNNRTGDIQELSDYRVLGNKMSQVFTAITSMKKSLYVTAHIQTFQDEKTKRITTEIGLPGAAKSMLPKLFSNIWLFEAGENRTYTMRTTPDPRGLKTIRSVIQGLDEIEDITIGDFTRPQDFGVGAILSGKKRPAANRPKLITAASGGGIVLGPKKPLQPAPGAQSEGDKSDASATVTS